MFKDKADTHAEGEEHTTAVAPEEADEYKNTGFFFVPIRPLIVPIIDGNDLMQTLYVSVSIEVDSERDYQRVSEMEPRLLDAFIHESSGILNDPKVRTGNLVNVPKLRKSLYDASQRIMDEGVIQSVVIESITQSPADN
jgi:flagellar basal body-associated protein FliL